MGGQNEEPKVKRLTADERRVLEMALANTRNYGLFFGVLSMVCFYFGFFIFGAIDLAILLYMWWSNEVIAGLLSSKDLK